MLRPAAVTAVCTSIVIAGKVHAQSIDTARVRTAYEAVTKMRNDYEQSHGHFVTVNGIRMHYLDWGDRKGTPLIWAHGSASSGYELRDVAPRLAQAGYRVIAIDYRGHGQTRVTNYDFGIYHIADDVVAMLDSLKISKAIFGGASKGGFVAAAVYNQYPNRVLGLLMADGGTWSNQWVYDRRTPAENQSFLADPLPVIKGASEFAVFLQVVGNIPPGELPIPWLFDMLTRIGRDATGEWSFLPGYDQMMGSNKVNAEALTHPTVLPPLQWSQQSMIPRMVFRRLNVPMMILDPQEKRDHLPVTDQNERLAKDHPSLVIHRVYLESSHNILASRPDWFVRDASELLNRVRKRR